MAETLEEFLVSVKYGIDEPSQAKFFDALKRVSTSIAGIAGQIVGLGVAVLKLADHMSEAGTKLYWMGQRVNDSVGNIQAMSFALTELGLSGEHATTALNQITQWTSTRGPAATAYLRSLGVTAKDADGQLQQLGKRLLASGERGSIGYAIELARMRQFGLDEETLRRLGSKEYEEKRHEEGVIGRAVWGTGGSKEGVKRFTEASVKIAGEFGKMGYIFTSLSQRFAVGLFAKIQPELEKLNEALMRALPQIKAFLDQMVQGAPALLHFLEGAILGFGRLLEIGTLLLKTFHELPEVLKIALAAFVLLPKALNLFTSPLFLMLAGLTTLMMLLDDYKHWQDDQKVGRKGDARTSHWEWGETEKMIKGMTDNPLTHAIENNPMVKSMMKLNAEFSTYVTSLTGIPGLLEGIELAAVALLAKWGLGAMLGLGKGAVKGAVTAAPGAVAGMARLAFTSIADWGMILAAAVEAAVGSAVVMAALAPAALAIVTGLVLHDVFPWLFGDRPVDLARKPTKGKTWVQDDDGSWREMETETPQATPNNARAPSAPRPASPGARGRGGGGRQHGSLTRGGPQVATAGDDWAGYIQQGMDSAHEDDSRLFDMLKLNLEAVISKLQDILDTLIAMAIKSGADLRHMGIGGGGGGGGVGNPDVPDLAGMTADEKNKLGLIRYYESKGGQNIMNDVGLARGVTPTQAHGYTAQGYYQMLNANWAKIAPLYHITAPNAMAATDAEQTQVALHLLRHGGIGNWTNYNPALKRAIERGERANSHTRVPDPSGALRHQPLGAGGGAGGGAGAGDARGGTGASLEQHNNTSIMVTAPSPASAAMQVADQMPRVYENHIRFAKGALLA